MDANIRLSTYQIATVKKGFYQMTLTETAKIEGQSQSIVSTQELDFVMSGNRFIFDSSMIYATYPPRDSEGEFETCLPHVLLRNASYPWDHGYRSSKESNIPGIALFLFSEEEAKEQKIKEKTMPVNQVYQKTSKVYTPKRLMMSMNDNENGEEECQIVDIPVHLFRRMCPSEKELQLLSHVKEVSLDNKEHDPLIECGKFACITGNRLPAVSKEKDEKVKHTSYVVSLAEYEDYLQMSDNEQKKELAAYKHVRVIVLYKWSFHTTKEPYNFLSVIKKIKPNILCYHPDLDIDEQEEDKELLNILKKGYLPLNHDMRDGSKTVSWYRGPLLPILQDAVEPSYHVFSDELYYFDPEIGMFDVSYACAWKLGRMLSLQDLSLCKDLLMWRMKNCHAAAMRLQTTTILKEMSPADMPLSQELERIDVKEALQKLCKNVIDALPSYEVKNEDEYIL